MNRNVEINVPMFIGIILLVAAITAILVYGVNKTKDLMDESNNKYTSTVNNIEDWFNHNSIKNEEKIDDDSNIENIEFDNYLI